MHRGCTTVLEAAQLNKKIIYLKKFNYNKKNWLDCFGTVVDKQKNDISTLSKILNQKIHKDQKYDNSIITNLNSKKFYSEFIKFLNNKKFRKIKSDLTCYDMNIKDNYFNNQKVFLKKFLLKIKILNKLLLDYNADLILPQKYLTTKFREITKKEIMNDLNNFSKEDNSKKDFNILKIHNNSYLINL